MASTLTRSLVVAATVVTAANGSLLDRALIATPAWNYLGVQAWAAYSRHADLGVGNIVYPVEGILAWVLILAAAASYFSFDRAVIPKAALPIVLTVLGALGWIGTTVKAAPVMQSVARLGDDPLALRSAYHEFTLWGVYVRDGFTGLAFLAAIWSIIEVFRVQVDQRAEQNEGGVRAGESPAAR
jgi:hypothetical protein